MDATALHRYTTDDISAPIREQYARFGSMSMVYMVLPASLPDGTIVQAVGHTVHFTASQPLVYPNPFICLTASA